MPYESRVRLEKLGRLERLQRRDQRRNSRNPRIRCHHKLFVFLPTGRLCPLRHREAIERRNRRVHPHDSVSRHYTPDDTRKPPLARERRLTSRLC